MKNVIKILLFFFMINLYSQKKKYLIFNKSKDSIVSFDNNKIKYYYIDKDRFLITGIENNYNIDIDTIFLKEVQKNKIYSPEELLREGNKIIKSMKKESLKTKKLKIISTYNELFKYIYILERISPLKYKKTRVWWDDIIGCSG